MLPLSAQVSPSEIADIATQSVSLPRNVFQVLLDSSRLTLRTREVLALINLVVRSLFLVREKR